MACRERHQLELIEFWRRHEEKILRLIAENNKISAEELADAIGITPRAVEKQIAKLKDQKKLERIGPDHGGHWKILLHL